MQGIDRAIIILLPMHIFGYVSGYAKKDSRKVLRSTWTRVILIFLYAD